MNTSSKLGGSLTQRSELKFVCVYYTNDSSIQTLVPSYSGKGRNKNRSGGNNIIYTISIERTSLYSLQDTYLMVVEEGGELAERDDQIIKHLLQFIVSSH